MTGLSAESRSVAGGGVAFLRSLGGRRLAAERRRCFSSLTEGTN